MSNYLVSNTDLESVANAIRTKGGTSAQLAFPSDFVSAINAISAGGGEDYLAKTLNNTSDFTYESTDVTKIKSYTFRGCTHLVGLNLPNLTTISTGGLYGCTGLTELFFDNLTGTDGQALMGCTNLETFVSKKAISSTGGSDVNGCKKLASFDMGTGSGRFSGSYFEGCTLLNMIVIRSSSTTTLSSTSVFKNTPFASGGSGGTLYVPQSKISDYQGASNWSTILGYANNSIKSIESTHTDPNAPIDLTLYYADGTPIS